MISRISKIIKFGYDCSKLYILWILIHFISNHLYIHFCLPKTIIGFLSSPFMVMTPHCVVLNWFQTNSYNIIYQMWFILGTYCVTKITQRIFP